jgi:hypothetical protein
LKPSSNDAPPTNDGLDPSMLQVPVDFCPPFDLVNVHDWRKMPIPQGETSTLMCMYFFFPARSMLLPIPLVQHNPHLSTFRVRTFRH